MGITQARQLRNTCMLQLGCVSSMAYTQSAAVPHYFCVTARLSATTTTTTATVSTMQSLSSLTSSSSPRCRARRRHRRRRRRRPVGCIRKD